MIIVRWQLDHKIGHIPSSKPSLSINANICAGWKIQLPKNWWKKNCQSSPPGQRGVNWTYVRRSKDVQDVLGNCYVRSIYVLSPVSNVIDTFIYLTKESLTETNFQYQNHSPTHRSSRLQLFFKIGALNTAKFLKVLWCRFENLPLCSSLYEKNTLKIPHS